MDRVRPFAARHEYKYIVEETKARAIREYVCAHLGSDPHCAVGEGYPVSSIYLDSLTYALYLQTERGQRNRFKLRVRYYDSDPGSPVFFEVKRRDGAIIRKQRTALDRQAATRVLRGNALPINNNHPLELRTLSEFCRLRNRTAACRYTYVGYQREAFGSASLSNLRVTFDRALVAGIYHDRFLSATSTYRQGWTA